MNAKKISIVILMAGLCLQIRADESRFAAEEDNPLLKEYRTPFETPPFDEIRNEHFIPAFEEGIRLHEAEIRAIVENKEKPTFENTIVALERSGFLLNKVDRLYSNMMGACPSEELSRLGDRISPVLTRHENETAMNEGLFRRIRDVYEMKESLDLNGEDRTLLEKTYQEYARSGALLDNAGKNELKKINEELDEATRKFAVNISKEKSSYRLVVDVREDLTGLPEDAVRSAADIAAALGRPGCWAFTLQGSNIVPFLRYSSVRRLREKIYRASADLGCGKNEFNNESLVVRIANLRSRKAKLLNYKSYAHYVQKENMAGSPDAVVRLLNGIQEPALEKAKKEAVELQAFINKRGWGFKLEPWDWAYVAERLKESENILDERELTPYFKLENVRDGAFYVAHRLFGLTFEERKDIARYSEDVQIFEVKEVDGTHVGIFIVDYPTRAGKIYLGYMNYFRKASMRDGRRVTPIVCNVETFTRTAGRPSLLSLDEVKILFHEFGHALHELLSRCVYEKLSGTNTAKDFTEMPSRFMERWAFLPEVLRVYAKHFETGEVLPEALIDKIQRALRVNQGYDVVGLAASSFLDLEWHALEEGTAMNCRDFEKSVLDKIGRVPQIDPRYRSAAFIHVFGGSYAATYYSYLWSEVLAADAFEVFRKAGFFNPGTALSFRTNILEKGGSEDAGILYRRFQGDVTGLTPFLESRGLAGSRP